MEHLVLGKDKLIRRQLTAWDEEAGKNTKEAADGLVATCRITASNGEQNPALIVAIHVDLEYTPMEDRENGDVWCIVRGTHSLERLISYIGKVVYACVTVAGTTYVDYEPFLVVGNQIVGGATE